MRPIRLKKDWLVWKVGHVFHGDMCPSQEIRELLVKDGMAEWIKYVAEDN